VLSADARLRTGADFAAVVKGGLRAGTRRLVIHLLPTRQQVPPRAGFVVSAKVGNSVVRHRVTRRLRPLVREQLGSLPVGTALVIRALPAAATASSAELGVDLRSGLASAIRKAASSSRSVTRPGSTAKDGGPAWPVRS
jgi:ribonuclease P protein component